MRISMCNLHHQHFPLYFLPVSQAILQIPANVVCGLHAIQLGLFTVIGIDRQITVLACLTYLSRTYAHRHLVQKCVLPDVRLHTAPSAFWSSFVGSLSAMRVLSVIISSCAAEAEVVQKAAAFYLRSLQPGYDVYTDAGNVVHRHLLLRSLAKLDLSEEV